MKKILVLMMALIMTLTLAVGCGQKGSEEKSDGGEKKSETLEYETIGDISGYDDSSFVYDEKTFVFVFTIDGVTYRATCDMPEDISKEINKLDAADEDFSEKAVEVAAPLKIAKLENLDESAPSQEELDKYIGKTGKELLEEGWTVWAYTTEDNSFGMNYGSYNVKVVFDGKIAYTEDAELEKLIEKVKVKSIKYDGIGDAATIEYE